MSRLVIIGRDMMDMPDIFAVSGTTRDRSYGNATWLGRTFTLIDTGGLLGLNMKQNEPSVILRHIRDQTLIAMQEAAVVIYMVDVHQASRELPMHRLTH